MAKRESINFDRVAHQYDETRGGEVRGRQFAPDLARLLRTDCTTLEVGVGTGVIAVALGEEGLQVVGLDISAHMLARARERLGNVVARADAMSLPIGTASIDQAISVWVLHVVADPSRVLREVARCLRPGGRYLVMDGAEDEDPDDPVRAAWLEIAAGLGMERRSGRVHLYAELAPAAELRVVDITRSGPHSFESSPANAADRLESRTNSWAWSVSDDDWQRVVVPVIAKLRSLPHAERLASRAEYQEILVLER